MGNLTRSCNVYWHYALIPLEGVGDLQVKGGVHERVAVPDRAATRLVVPDVQVAPAGRIPMPASKRVADAALDVPEEDVRLCVPDAGVGGHPAIPPASG